MDGTDNTPATPEPSSPSGTLDQLPPPPTAVAEETGPLADPDSRIAILMQRLAEEIDGLRRERTKLRADAEAEATRIVDAARADAGRIREQAEAWVANTRRAVLSIADDIERARESLGAAIGTFGADIGERAPSHRAEAEAITIGDAGDGQRTIGEETPTPAVDADRAVHAMIDDIGTLAELIGEFDEDIGERVPAQDVVVIPDASGNASAA
jgi:hypothetical protein